MSHIPEYLRRSVRNDKQNVMMLFKRNAYNDIGYKPKKNYWR